VLRIQGLNAVLFIQGRMEKAVITADTTVLLRLYANDKGTDCSVVSTGKRGNDGYGCSYSSTVRRQFYGYREYLQCC